MTSHGEDNMPPLPCEQEQNIQTIIRMVEENRAAHKADTTRIETSVGSLVEKQERFLDKLEAVLLEDRDMKKDIEQAQKDIDAVGDKIRQIKSDVDSCKETRAKMQGMGVMERFPKVWDWYQQEQGWRRFIPTAMAGLAWLATMYNIFGA